MRWRAADAIASFNLCRSWTLGGTKYERFAYLDVDGYLGIHRLCMFGVAKLMNSQRIIASLLFSIQGQHRSWLVVNSIDGRKPNFDLTTVIISLETPDIVRSLMSKLRGSNCVETHEAKTHVTRWRGHARSKNFSYLQQAPSHFTNLQRQPDYGSIQTRPLLACG